MKILKRIKKIARSPKTGKHTNSANNLPLVTFHSVHGDNIRISQDGMMARRVESFCEGIVFSSRPIRVNELVSIKFADTSSTWSGALRFGFTTTDPSKLRHALPKYACPELTSKPGFWAKALSERYSSPETILTYYADESGKVHYAINGEDKGIYLTEVDVSRPFWALLDIYGYTSAIQLIDSRYNIKNRFTENGSKSSASITTNHYSTLPPMSKVNREPLPQIYRNNNLTPLPFHRTRGCNITLSSDGSIAERSDSHYSRGYVFSQRPLRPGEKLVIQILKTDELYAGSLAFGLTTCNPSCLNGNDLPEDPHTLLDRPEYWIVIKDVANAPTAGDEIAFKLTESGQVLMFKNRQAPITLMHVDQTQSFYAFFDLYGSTIKIKSLGSISEKNSVKSGGHLSPLQQNHNIINRMTLNDRQKSWSTWQTNVPTENSNSMMINLSPMNSRFNEYRTLPQSHSTGSLNIGNECTVCYEQSINCVLYTCGHMCMCYECAVKQWKGQGGGKCPICRARIMDVIRTYYA